MCDCGNEDGDETLFQSDGDKGKTNYRLVSCATRGIISHQPNISKIGDIRRNFLGFSTEQLQIVANTTSANNNTSSIYFIILHEITMSEEFSGQH